MKKEKALNYDVIEMTNRAVLRSKQARKEKRSALFYELWAWFLVFGICLYIFDLSTKLIAILRG